MLVWKRENEVETDQRHGYKEYDRPSGSAPKELRLGHMALGELKLTGAGRGIAALLPVGAHPGTCRVFCGVDLRVVRRALRVVVAAGQVTKAGM